MKILAKFANVDKRYARLAKIKSRSARAYRHIEMQDGPTFEFATEASEIAVEHVLSLLQGKR